MILAATPLATDVASDLGGSFDETDLNEASGPQDILQLIVLMNRLSVDQLNGRAPLTDAEIFGT